VKKDLTDEQIERLIGLPIRKTTAYDSAATKTEIKSIESKIAEVELKLKDPKKYAINWLDDTIKLIKAQSYDGHRRSEISTFETISVKEVVQKDIAVKYNADTGYAGTSTSGDVLFSVDKYAKIMVIHNDGSWYVTPIKEFTKVHVGSGAIIEEAIKENFGESREFTLVYDKAGKTYVKKFSIKAWTEKKVYKPVDGKVWLFKEGNGKFKLEYEPKKGSSKTEETFNSKTLSGKITARVIKMGKWL
jgi:topoisomerase-4 subunit A